MVLLLVLTTTIILIPTHQAISSPRILKTSTMSNPTTETSIPRPLNKLIKKLIKIKNTKNAPLQNTQIVKNMTTNNLSATRSSKERCISIKNKKD